MTTPDSKPRIAIPEPTSFKPSYNERCWPQFAAAIEAVGGEPVRISLELAPDEAAKLISTCSAILLPGSPADVNPQKYGQAAQPETAEPDRPREATDELLLQDAFNLRKPLLGVCFGLQMMNVWRGGTLTQHLKTAMPHSPAADEAPLEHGLELNSAALLLPGFFDGQQTPSINSSHHQAIDIAGDGLRVAARAEGDKTIEALEGIAPGEQFVLGVQWHPERSYETDAPSLRIFTAFVEAARKWHLPQA